MLLTLLLTALLPAAFAQAVSVTPDYAGNCQRPVWSPDGRMLSYEVNFHDRKVVELYTYSPGEGARQIRPVSRGSSAITSGFATTSDQQTVHELSWSPPDRKTFVFTASGADRNYDVYLDPGTALSSHPAADGGAVWSPDGAHIAFTSARTGEGDLYLLDVADLSKPPAQLTSSPTASELFAAWSPDGESLAYVEHTETGDVIRYIEDVEDPEPKTLVGLGGTQTRPSFSPDGRQLAFYSDHEERGRFDLYVMPLDGAPKRLATGVVMNALGPQWMPNSAALVFVLDDDARFDPVLQVKVAGGPAKPVPTRTVGNGDHHVIQDSQGKAWLAIAAQGELKGEGSDFRKVFVMQLN